MHSTSYSLPFLTPDQPGEAWSVQGMTYWLNNIELSTPRDFDKVPPNAPLFQFTAEPDVVPFEQIQKIVLIPQTHKFHGSRPDAMEVYPLGSVRNAIPPPPNWKRTIEQVDVWQRAQPTARVDALPYLNHAVFCWAAPDDGPQNGSRSEANVYLMRQGVSIERPDRAMRASLRLATNADLLEVSFNEWPLHLAGAPQQSIAEFEVTPLLQRGINIVAVRLRERPASLDRHYGLAFHLDIIEPNDNRAVTRPPSTEGQALVVGQNGDRVWGWVEEIQGDQAQLATAYGPLNQAWLGIGGLLFPAGWHDAPEKPGFVPRILGARTRNSAKAGHFDLTGLPVDRLPNPPQDVLLLTDGRMTSAKPGYVREGSLVFEGNEGKQFSVPREQVLAIYPPRPAEFLFKRPSPPDAQLFCQLTTSNGDRLSGLLRQFNGKEVVLETETDSILQLKPEWVASLLFPYHAAAPARTGTIGLIELAAGQEAYREAFRTDSRAVQGAAFAIGAEAAAPTPDQLADEAQLTPQQFPVLVSVDPTGEYLHTLKQPRDAQKALLAYLERGGILVALSRGGPFKTALISDANGLGRAADEFQKPSLLEQLGIVTLHVGEKAPITRAARAFDHPPNEASEVFFQRGSELPAGLLGLPRYVLLEPTLSARFYPVISTDDAAKVVYEMLDENGQVYGPALSLMPKGRGMVVIIDHLLWTSRPDGQPFHERALPIILRWALDSAQN